MPTLRVKYPDGTEQALPLDAELTVGRAEGNDLVLSEGGVSRRHARLIVERGQVLVEDLGSANGSFLDGERLEQPAPLEPGSVLVIGEYEISVDRRSVPRPKGASALARADGGDGARERAPRAAPARSAAVPRGGEGGVARPGRSAAPERGERPARGRPGAAADSAADLREEGARPRRREPGAALARREPAAGDDANGPFLRGLTGPWARRRFPVDGKIVIGRVASVDVQLEDDSVSRRHAELEVTDEGVVLRDLGSANGSQVNGHPVEGEVLLQPGDILSFGVVDLAFEDPSAGVPVRRGRAGLGRPDAEGLSPRGRMMLWGGLGVGALVFAGIFFQMFSAPERPPDGRLVADRPVAALDPQAELQLHLSQCRSYAAADIQEPDWVKAEIACDKALDINPIHEEANELVRRIKLEKGAAELFERAEKAMGRLREEEALQLYRELPAESLYYRRAKPRVKQAIDGVKKRAGEECRRYVKNRSWQAALPRCELYMTIACQTMKDEDLYPPPGHRIKLSGRLGRNEWRPPDAMYRRFLEVRERTAGGDAAPWRCLPSPIYNVGEKEEDPGDEIRRVMRKRYPDPALQKAAVLYWEGNASEAAVVLQKFRDNYQKAEHHQLADELRKDISTAENLFKSGQTALQVDELERAAEDFTEALQIDERLMKDEAKVRPSSYRRNIERDIAAAAYRLGKHWTDRQDPRKGCKLWKIGFGFYQGNTDLNRAAAYCSTLAGGALAKARSCPELEDVLTFAVVGDGIAEKVQAKKVELKCP